MIGLVYYVDDPDKKIFRKVFPNYVLGDTDAVLDDPQWVTFGCDPARTAVLIKAPDDDPRAVGEMTGTP